MLMQARGGPDGGAASDIIDTVIILGGSGDLATRYLLPAAAELLDAGLLPERIRFVAVDQAELDDAAYREQVSGALRKHAGGSSERARDTLCTQLHYRTGSATDAGDLRRVLAGSAASEGPVAVYLALPNALFQATIEALAEAGLPTGSRLAVEKPFGVDLADARQLNALIRQDLHEDHVFRVDHVMAERSVLSVLGLRFANRVLEPAWSAEHIESVDIVWDETIALEGRAGYYDHAGALRDMIQNHLLQILAVVAMEAPSALDERELRDRKAELFRAVRAPGADEMPVRSRRARYAAGQSPSGHAVPAYVDEPDVDPARMTETYAEVTFIIDTPRWDGVPFTLRTGKAMAADRREIVVRFRPSEHDLFGTAGPSVLRLSLAPDAASMELNLNGADDPSEPRRRNLSATIEQPRLSPYSLVLREVFEGDPTLAVRGDEAEECWRIVEPVLAAWAAGEVPLEEYPAGSGGPTAR